MARMSNDDVSKNKDYDDSLQLTNWILDSGATCHMTPEVTGFISGTLEDTDKFIEVADGHHVTANHKGSLRIQMFDDNGETFIATLYNVLLHYPPLRRSKPCKTPCGKGTYVQHSLT